MKADHQRARYARQGLDSLLIRYVADRYEADDKILFQQVDLNGPSVSSLFVDVPFACRSDTPAAVVLAEVRSQRTGDPQLKLAPAGWEIAAAAQTLLEPAWTESAILIGGPGQGKSTLFQYVCQFHRARILGKASYDAANTDLYRAKSQVRFPVRIDLRDYAHWASRQLTSRRKHKMKRSDQWPTIAEYLTYEIDRRSDGEVFSLKDFVSLVITRPLLIALDGLDEVSNLNQREIVGKQIVQFRARFDPDAADLVVLVSSRPGGITAELMSNHSMQVMYLRQLTQGLRVQYLRKWSTVLGLPSSSATRLQDSLLAHQNLPHIKELGSTPMQLAILLHLLHRRQLLPQQRTELYRDYLKTFLDREESENKEPLLGSLRSLIVDIHSYLAWFLQIRSERGIGSGSIDTEELKGLLRQQLEGRVRDQGVLDQLFSAFTGRVLCLIERDGAYQFEVQSLREYFAALYIFENAPVRGENNSRDDVLNALLVRPNWSNVARFLVGMFSHGEVRGLSENLRTAEEAVAPHPLARIYAAALLDDQIYRSQADRPLHEVVDFILTGPGVTLGEDGVLSSSGAPIDFIDGAGRDQAIDYLKTRLPVEDGHRSAVVSTLRRVARSDKELARWWSAQAGQVRHWLVAGSSFRCLSRSTGPAVQTMVDEIESFEISDVWAVELLLAGGCDYDDERILKLAHRQLNAGAISLTGEFYEHERPSATRLERMAAIGKRHIMGPVRATSDEIHLERRTEVGPAAEAKMIQRIDAAENAVDQFSTTGDLAALVSSCYGLWGDGWVTRRMIARLRSQAELESAVLAVSANDDAVGRVLMSEFGARQNREDGSWWKKYLRQCKTELDRASWAIHLMTLGGRDALRENGAALDSMVAKFSPRLFAAVEAEMYDFGRYDRELAFSEDLRLQRVSYSLRVLWLLRSVSNAPTVEQIHRTLGDEVEQILAVGFRDARKPLVVAQLTRTRVLRVEALAGARGQLPIGGWIDKVNLGKMSSRQAGDVLASPELWPSEIVQLAAQLRQDQIASGSVPLGDELAVDGWAALNRPGF